MLDSPFQNKKRPAPIGSGPHSRITTIDSDTRPYSHFPNNEERRTKNDHR